MMMVQGFESLFCWMKGHECIINSKGIVKGLHKVRLYFEEREVQTQVMAPQTAHSQEGPILRGYIYPGSSISNSFCV